MRDDRTACAAACAALVCISGLLPAPPAAAQVERSEAVYRQEALGHADAVMRGYRRLEQHIREESTALTDGSTWANAIPPAATGWLADWTLRGVRARYCEDTLLVYVDAARLKGVGADHRAVQVALRVYAPGRNRGPTGPGLHWLENDVVTEVGGTTVVTLPGCLTTPALPSGRAAFAGRVRDPFATANLRQRRYTEVMDPPQPCAAGEHGTGRTMFRDVVETLNDRNEAVGSPAVGAWQVLVDGCRADYTVTERYTQTCSWLAGPPHNRTLTGIEVWQRTKTVTQGGEVFGPASMVSTSCWNGDGTGAAPVNANVTVTVVPPPDRREVACGGGENGFRYEVRDNLRRTAQFAWDAAPIVTVGKGPWRSAGNNCVPPDGTVSSLITPTTAGWICSYGVQCGGYGWLANNAWNDPNSWAQVGDTVTVNNCPRCSPPSTQVYKATPHGWLPLDQYGDPVIPVDPHNGNPAVGLDHYYMQYRDRKNNPACMQGWPCWVD